MQRLPAALMIATLCLPVTATAQETREEEDSAFLACQRFDDRQQRLRCLEEALQAATAGTEEATRSTADTPVPAPSPDSPDTAATENDSTASGQSDSQTAESQHDNETDRVAAFGRKQPRVEENDSGEETLHDTVTDLDEVRPNQWRISLASGQVWFQVHPRRFNLREGYPVRIYNSDWGENYRLKTERLSGFIQVQRLE